MQHWHCTAEKKSRNLDKAKHGLSEDANVFINESLCKPMNFLHYKVRLALKEEKIVSFKIWKGKLPIKMNQTLKFNILMI